MRENMTFLTNYYQIREMTIDRMKEIIDQNKRSKEGGTVFFGDSITQFMDIEKYFPEIENKYNCGIGGITSTMLLHFIDEGVLKFKPKQLVYMIGTNDLGKTVMQSPKDIAINVKELVETVHYNLPECEIYVVSPLPCLPMHDYKHTPGVLRSNDLLKMIYKEFKKTIPYEYATFINAYPTLCNKKGEPIEAYFEDGLHINHDGYVRYTNCLKEYIL
ncbi:GDSL-type esterase/lipase family protein [Faecalibacillus intestinalis]|uniref:GDSL-type esterase/lipase family protein n=1 Tax=Faecalibacillus intestinalis TaxID=1982626 RepID=UPI003AB328F9